MPPQTLISSFLRKLVYLLPDHAGEIKFLGNLYFLRT